MEYARYQSRGYATGSFVKTTSKIIVYVVGGILATLQLLSYKGYISINYDKIVRDSSVNVKFGS